MSLRPSGLNSPVRARSACTTSARSVVKSCVVANGTMAIGRAATSPPATVISSEACSGRASSAARAASAGDSIGQRVMRSAFRDEIDDEVALEDRRVLRARQRRGTEYRVFDRLVEHRVAAALL